MNSSRSKIKYKNQNSLNGYTDGRNLLIRISNLSNNDFIAEFTYNDDI